MAIRCRFVDSISATPTIRLDLNAGDPGFWLGKGGLRCPPPPLRRFEGDPATQDGGPVSGSKYSNRDLGLPLSFRPGTMDLRNALVSSMIQELNRPTNILEYRPDGSSTSYFFRTFRSPNFDPTLWLPKNPVGMIDVDLYAEPFAYGLRVDQAGVVVNADPAAVSNGCYLDVNGVTGDVETLAYVNLTAGTVGSLSPSYLAVRRHGTPASLPFVQQAENATGPLGTDTIVTASHDATASGAGNNTTTTSFATATAMTKRLTLPFAATNQVETRGTFRVLARVKKTVGTDTIQLTNLFASNTAVTLATGTSWQFVDLGLTQYPLGEDSYTGYSGVQPPLSSALTYTLYAARPVGTGNLLVDYLIFLPADENLSILTTTGLPAVLDGPNDTFYVLDGSGGIRTQLGQSRAGSPPVLRPGNNRLYFVENTTTATVTDTTTIAVSWWPRYLTV